MRYCAFINNGGGDVNKKGAPKSHFKKIGASLLSQLLRLFGRNAQDKYTFKYFDLLVIWYIKVMRISSSHAIIPKKI